MKHRDPELHFRSLVRNGTDEELVKVKFSFIHLGHSFNKQVLDAYLSGCVLCLGYSGKKKKIPLMHGTYILLGRGEKK